MLACSCEEGRGPNLDLSGLFGMALGLHMVGPVKRALDWELGDQGCRCHSCSVSAHCVPGPSSIFLLILIL